MIGIIVSGHGHFATGITAALNLILGEQEHYNCVEFPAGDTLTELENNMKAAIAAMEDMEHIVIFTDLLSGSPFNVAIMEAMKNEKLRVVYGTNLGMLIEGVMRRNMGESLEELIAGALETGRSQIGLFTEPEEEDDDF